MAQTTILAAGNTAATSTDIVIADAQPVNVGVFGSAATHLPRDVIFSVLMVTPGAAMPIAQLGLTSPAVSLQGPGTFRVVRPAYAGAAFGVFLDAAV